MPRMTRRELAIQNFGADLVEHMESIVNETIETLLSSPALARNGIRRRRSKPLVTFRWSVGKSHGGVRGLRFAMLPRALMPIQQCYIEYKALADHPMIGSYTGTRDECLRILAAHELAHWLQYAKTVKRPPGNYRAPHGSGFQAIYWILRDVLRMPSNIRG